MVVKVGGMCWVISTGARSSTLPIWLTMALSACGPPVEEPITSTLGGVGGNARSTIGCAAARSFGGSGSAVPAPGADARRLTGRSRFERAPSWRIFSISSRRKAGEPVISRLLAGFGM